MAIFAFAIVAKLPIVSTQIIVLGRRDNHYTMETVYIHCIIITHQLIRLFEWRISSLSKWWKHWLVQV